LTPATSGVYHYAGAPDTTWAAFATEILTRAGKATQVTAIPSTAYPTPAPRPLNSALDCRKIEAAFGLVRPDWRAAIPGILRQLEDSA